MVHAADVSDCESIQSENKCIARVLLIAETAANPHRTPWRENQCNNVPESFVEDEDESTDSVHGTQTQKEFHFS
jgi:hypothetical protein